MTNDAARSTQHATRSTQHAARSTQHAARSTQHAARSTQHATRTTMPIITLTTDFGLTDSYVGAMKGVILGLCPDARLVDLSHDIAAQNVTQAAYVLAAAAPYFPAGTIHLAVVDPGVGGERWPLVVQTGRALCVGPDNGLFSPFLTEPGACAWALDRPEFWLPQVSRTFHGRDIFAPVAAHLARGVLPGQMGQLISDPVLLPLTEPVRHPDGHVTGQVIYADRFGNLITNVPAAWVAAGRWRVEIAGQQIAGIRAAYADAQRGELLALVSSGGTVEVAVREGSAAARLGVGVGAAVDFWPVEGAISP
ncbi:MAG: SAM-dependent chlorinase/fluorinase [Chloroflexi bacterium]|nr:SAM-dependent chlorinase/fluorinase [Chloroflexota bacterium]